MLVNVFGKNIETSEEQDWKQKSPILVTDSGMSIAWRAIQPWIVPLFRLVKEEGIVTDSRSSQPWKHLSPTLVTDDGMSIDWRPQPENALVFNVVKDDGKLIVLSSIQPPKQKGLKLVSDSGRVTDSM